MLRMTMNVKRMVLLPAAVASAALGAQLLGSTSSGAAPTPAPAVHAAPVSDPVLAALGIGTPEERQRLVSRQEATAKDAAVSRSTRVAAAKGALGDAVDALYAEIANDPAAEPYRDQWRACMAAGGTPFESPAAVEKALNDANDGGRDLAAARANRERCEGDLDDELAQAVGNHYAAWAKRYQGTFDEYRKALGL